ncbi:MAG TPA: thioesterase family protein [Bordetella sp.]
MSAAMQDAHETAGAPSYGSEMQVRFRHCDPAGIVFYPRYFEMINDFVEEWFDKALGHSYHTLHVDMRLGTPTASIQCDFTAPSRWHDVLRQELAVRRVGGSSISLDVRFVGQDDGRQRLAASLTIVFVDLKTLRPAPPPDALRSRLAAYLAPAAPAGQA